MRAFLCLLLFVSGVMGQEEVKKIELRNFRGLNTVAGDFSIKPNEARVAHNIDWSRNIGSITKRYGYTFAGNFENIDSILAMEGVAFSDGTRRMFYVIDPDSTGYGQVLVSQPGQPGFKVIDTVNFQSGAGASDFYIYFNDDTATYSYGAGEDLVAIIDSLMDSVTVNITGLTADTTTATFTDCGQTATESNYHVLVLTQTLSGAESPTYALGGRPPIGGGPPCVNYRRGVGTIDGLEIVWPYWGVQKRPKFGKHNDNVYIVNSQQKGIVWNENGSRTWPPRSPGEPIIVPLTDWGPLNGEYIYRFAINGRGVSGTVYSSGFADGAISSRVRIKNGQTLLRDFPEPTYDSTGNLRRWITLIDVDAVQNTTAYWVTVGDDSAGITSDGSATASEITDSLIAHFTSDGVDSAIAVDYGNADSFVVKGEFDYGLHGGVAVSANLTSTLDTNHQYRIYRTNANPGRIERSDSVDLVKVFTVHYSDSAFYTDTSFTDSVTDGTLDAPLFSTNLYGRDSLGVLIMRYGAPGYLSMVDTGQVYDTASDTLGNEWGIYYGIPKQKDTLGVMYGCTFIDTLTGIESAIGPSLAVYNDEGGEPYSITVSLPNIPSNDSGLVINLYRAHILQVTYDSAVWKQVTKVFDKGRLAGAEYITFDWVSVLAVDTVVVDDYYLVGQYPSMDSQVTDSIRFDSLSTRHRYARSTPPALLSDVFSWDNRLWGISGNEVWPSKIVGSPIDTLQEWLQANPIPINPGDGENIILSFIARAVIRILKPFSSFNIFQNSILDWRRVEVSGTFGCIASHSYAKGFEGHYYLSDVGVIRETEGPNLERTQSIELVSAPIESFNNMSVAERSEAIGVYFDRQYMLCVPAVGTTYVYFADANAWATSGMTFDGATHFATGTDIGYFPSDSMYFFRGDSVFRYGGTETDAGTNIPITWHSAPLLTDGQLEKLQNIGLWATSPAGSYDFNIVPVGEDGTKYDTVQFNPLSKRYRVKGVGVGSASYFQLQCNSGDLDSAVIDGMDIWYTDEGPVIVE